MKTLIVVDMQNDFVDGSLGSKEAVSIVDKVKEKIQKYKNDGQQIIYTRDTHYENYLETPEGKKLPVKHCIKDSHGWNIVQGLYVEGSQIVDKESFGYTGWNKMDFGQTGQIELVGLCTDICVVSNALILKAMFPDIEISVDSSCCAGVTPQSHNSALQTMKMCQIEVI